MNSLAGKTILVTRSIEQSAGLASMLESRGAKAMLFPCIEIKLEPIPEIDWAHFDSIVFTSHNGQKAFASTPIPPQIQTVTYADRLTPRGRVLLVQGNLADNFLHDTLRSRGHDVTRLLAYRTENGSGGINLAEHQLDAITLTSPSAARNFLERGGPKNIPVACIGTTTYGAARTLGYSEILCSKEHKLDGLIRILEEHFS